MVYLITQTLNGLFSAALLFLIASGLTLVFGVMRIVNIAPGSFYMLGVYVAYSIVSRTQSLLLGAIAAVGVVAIVGVGVERLFLRRFTAQPLAQMMMTMGFALLFRDAAFMIWGGDPFTLPYPPSLRGSVAVSDVVFPLYRLFVIAMAVAVGMLVWALNEKTLIGAKLRAAVDDPDMAGATGINVALVSALVFGAGAGLAAVGEWAGRPTAMGAAAAVLASFTRRCAPSAANRPRFLSSPRRVDRSTAAIAIRVIAASAAGGAALRRGLFFGPAAPTPPMFPRSDDLGHPAIGRR